MSSNLTLAEAINLRKRDPETGLLVNHTYHFKPDGTIDYLAEVDRKYMFVIREREADVVKAQGKPISECDLSLVNEKWLRIRQSGWNQLANLRGYYSVDYHSLVSVENKAALVCLIEWIPNYETNGESFSCAGVASASLRSMDKNFVPYMETFAENRAFARAVKRALQINILSEDEIDAEAVSGVKGEDDTVSDATSGVSSAKEYAMLQDLCTKRKHPITFEAVKASAIKLRDDPTAAARGEVFLDDPATWIKWENIQPRDVFLLAGKIQEADKAAKKGAK